MSELYSWIKALHVIAIVAFMAGMLYLPRLFVYHAGVAKGSPESEIFKVMERRLDMAIMRPAFIILILTGGTLVMMGHWLEAHWLWAKLLFVILLIGEYVFLIRARLAFATDANRHSALFYRVINEVATLALIGIVIFVVVKPF
ncbi:MAG: CopD family protein [Methylovirgula sp.]